MSNVVDFQRVSKRYAGGYDALADVSFDLSAGELCFLTGRSGAGKSTLLKLIAAMERPTRGQLRVNGRNVGALKRRQIPAFRRMIGVIFQNYRLLYDRTVFDNVALPLIIRGMDRPHVERRVRAALDTVGLLGRERFQPITLSGGEQQRVGIARAIVTKPALLLADEPTGNLDPGLSQEIMRLFERFQQVGVSVLIATHDVSLIRRMRHRIITLDEGRVSADGSVQQGGV